MVALHKISQKLLRWMFEYSGLISSPSSWIGHIWHTHSNAEGVPSCSLIQRILTVASLMCVLLLANVVFCCFVSPPVSSLFTFKWTIRIVFCLCLLSSSDPGILKFEKYIYVFQKKIPNIANDLSLKHEKYQLQILYILSYTKNDKTW